MALHRLILCLGTLNIVCYASTEVIVNTTCSKQRGYQFGIQVCLPLNSSAVITIPFHALVNTKTGSKGEQYRAYYWYLTNDPQDTSWSTLVADQGNRWTPSWGTTRYAKHQKQLFKLTTTNDGLSLMVNLTTKSLWPPGVKTQGAGERGDCWGFRLWAHAAGTDPWFTLIICAENRTITNLIEPQVSPTTKRKGIQVRNLNNMTTDDWLHVMTGVSQSTNNWLLLAEEAANTTKGDCVVCMGSRPLLRVAAAPHMGNCTLKLLQSSSSSSTCSSWDNVFPVTQRTKSAPLFNSQVAQQNFTCIRLTGINQVGNVSAHWCNEIHNITVPSHLLVPRGDLWLWCGGKSIYDVFPRNASGICALINLMLPAVVLEYNDASFVHAYLEANRDWFTKRSINIPGPDSTYIDAIGVPRGVPDEYKLVDQVAAGFESFLFWWSTINKNVDRINYVHYNVQRLANYTTKGFIAVRDQLQATSLMTFQNRLAVDMLLAEKGGVCAMFGDMCCTFIPNNTAPGGELSEVVEGLRTLSKKMKEHSGVDTSIWDRWLTVFGKYKALVVSVLTSVAVFCAVLVLCGCCCIPCIRSLVERLIQRALGPMEKQVDQLYPLLIAMDHSDEDDNEQVV